MFGKTSDEVLKLVHDLVEKAAEIKQLSFSRLLSYWKRRIATTLQRENALFILNSSAHVLSATNRFDPECIMIMRRIRNCTHHGVMKNKDIFDNVAWLS